jgi:hypothetical protein
MLVLGEAAGCRCGLVFVLRMAFPYMLSQGAVIVVYFVTFLVVTLVLRPLFLLNYINISDMSLKRGIVSIKMLF